MNKRTWIFIAMLSAAFFIRLLWILHTNNTVDVWSDWWDDLAWNLVTGKGYAVGNPFISSGVLYRSWRPPGFPLFLAGIYGLFGHSYLAAKIFLAVTGSLSVLAGYFIGKKMFNETVGVLVMAAISLYPTFIFFTGYLTPETLVLFCTMLCIFFLTRDIERPSLSNYIFAGIFLGAAALCRTVMMFFFVFVVLWIFLNDKNKIEALKRSLLFVLFLIIVISPWVIRNYRIHHAFILNSTDSGQALYINNNPQAVKEPTGFAYFYNPEDFEKLSEIETNRNLSARAADFVKNNFSDYVKLTWRRFLNFWRLFPHTISGPGEAYSRKHQIFSVSYTAPLFLLAVFGFFYSMKSWRKLSLFYFLIVYYSGMHILVRATIRYRVPIEPYLILFASYGLWVLWTKLKDKPGT